MLSEERCQDLFDTICRASEADETEVIIGDGTQALTRSEERRVGKECRL